MNRLNGSTRTAVLTNSVSKLAGGLFWSVRPLSMNLLDLGRDLHVFGGQDSQTVIDLSEWGAVPVSTFRTVGPRAFSFQPGLLNAVRTYDPDLVHAHGLWTYSSVVSTGFSKGRRPYIISPHGMLDAWAWRNSRWKKAIAMGLYERKHLSEATALHALCDAERDAFRERGLRNPIAVIPNGVDLPAENSSPSAPSWAERVPRGGKCLLFLSRIHPKKGLPAFLESWAAVRRDKPQDAEQWHLIIAGWDQMGHASYLADLINRLRIEASVHMVGPQFDHQKQSTFSRADAFILPSLSEGLPMAILEAWSYGLPVLMTPECNLSIGFEKKAAICIGGTTQSQYNGLLELFEMSDRARSDMGARGRSLVIERYTWERVALDMARVYGWCLDGGTRPACMVE